MKNNKKLLKVRNFSRYFFVLLTLLLSVDAFSQTRIMPLGDSITGSPGCWRAYLWDSLQSAGYTDIDFVGTLGPQGCAVPHDGDNEGHGGILATNMASGNQLSPWLAATNPQIVLMHLGTNDVWSGRSTESILNAYSTLLNQMRQNNPFVILLVAQIIPMDPAASCSECDTRVINLNAAIPSWAASHSTEQSPIIVVDAWQGFSATEDTFDGVHPTNAGHEKISKAWFAELSKVLSGVTTTPSPTGQPSPTPTAPPAQPSANCEFIVSNNWGSGFTAQIVISNNGNSTINGWSVSWEFTDNTRISNGWNANISGNNPYTATDMGWNANIAPEKSVAFGVMGSVSGTISPPVFNSAICSK